MSRPVLRGLTALALAAGTAAAVPTTATAAPDGSGLVINEVYLNGGSNGATYKNKFVELYNPTDEDISVQGWSVQYRAYNQTANFSATIALGDRHVEPGGTLLVSGNANSTAGADLPTPDVTSTVAFSGNSNGGTIALVKAETPLTGDLAAVRANAALVDLIGYGSSNTFEGAVKADGYNVTASVTRAAGADTDVNANDFTTAAPSPVPCGAACDGPGDGGPQEPEPSPTVTIADIQGTGATSARVGQTVTTTGVVTALYSAGGFNGAYLQTPGTGGSAGPASHGLFVYGSTFAAAVELGDTVEVTGAVSEFNGLTQLTAASWQDAATPGTVTPTPVRFPLAEAQREALEGMLVDATGGTYTLTNNFGTNTYGELGLAAGDTVLSQPTNEVRPRTSAYDALVASNAARLITLDDGKSINFTSGANRAVPVPWLTAGNEVRTGASVTIDDVLVMDYRNNTWKLQPTEPFAAGDESATIEPTSTRDAQPKDVGGAVTLASFNVLNYFTTTGEDWVSSSRGTCTWYTDRAGERITVNSCTNNGPRGAANDASLARQQTKIVQAITTLDADVVSLEEIEDTGSLGGADRDEALKTLVAALNAEAGTDRWAPVLSPATIPTSGRDVIRTAFIYQRDVVQPVGPSVILDSPAFANARAPLAQEFRPVDGDAGQDFLAIVNHFKSKGSGDGADADQGDGQGASNRARVRQAEALVDFVGSLEQQTDTDRVFLLGDFNSYAKEDPLAIIEDAGFVNVEQSLTDEETYQFDGMHGSLDHVFASKAAFGRVTGADVWTINAPESIAREYSRYNNNVTDLLDASSPFRASDHDPVIVGFDPGQATEVATTTTARVPSVVWADEAFDVAVTVGSATGSPRGTVTVSSGGKVLGSAAVADGSATVRIPADSLRAGRRVLDLAFAGQGRYLDSVGSVAVEVHAESTLSAQAARGTYGKPTTITVTGVPGASGPTYATAGGRHIASALMIDGRAILRIPGTALRPGSTPVTVFYGGGRGVDPSHTTVRVTVAKAKASLTAKVLNGKVTPKTRAKVRVVVRTPGFTESSGKVRIYRGKKLLGTATVRNGKATVTLPRQKSSARLKAKFSGTSLTAPANRAFRLRVR
ncbi:ExeM/NucH family extracellular endonuclease [Aeromicrobium duanguangcaii]|uniref:ExeM/NucH family extracellular endonuclease n=1 Tax=Aeromicrobium duanguangcaii TaxID=2968086 RepID=A0ABY5KCQ7_9ACTN|nr:ExeM/NucH family extracellular endonuclease [Aeromicrobium duanguangcaii]MCD9155092.1 ExeM/NucH family extracellular endonuclease [Aeromicrobium duanguangcaii]UUI68254.1 ExeM/NucH family extracellular endonuclease [Aeromicrobium duanguangcaii]